MKSVLVAAALSHIASSVTVTINPASIGTFTIPPRLLGVGIEYLNHEIYGGGLYSQMIFGESFEEAVGTYSPGGAVSIASATNPAEKLRHCNYDLYMTATDGSQDFAFKALSPGLNGQADTVSFQSVNYPSYYISVDTSSGVEAGRLGIVDTANTAAYRDASTFKQVAALNGNAAQHSYQAFGQYNGYYIASNGRLQGPCSGGYRSPDSDIVLEQNPSNKAAASWSLVRGGGQPPSENGYVSCGAGRASSGVQVSTISKMWMADYTGSGNADLSPWEKRFFELPMGFVYLIWS